MQHSALAASPSVMVVGLCAAWCATCREFKETFEVLKATHPERVFVWLDIEDDAAVVGDIDVENFPSLAVFRGATPVFYGVSQPQHGVVERLILALEEAPEVNVPLAVRALCTTLRKQQR